MKTQPSSKSFDDFDPYAQEYAKIHNQNLKITGANSTELSQERVSYVRRDERSEPEQILDFGCGDGSTELFLSKQFPKSKLFGVDPSKESIQVAINRKIPNATFKDFDGAKLNFPDQKFDLIFIAGVLHHIRFEEHPGVMQECYRVLKPGGRIYIFEHNPLNPLTLYIVKDCVFDQDAKLLSFKYLKNQLCNAGFSQPRTRFFIFFPRFLIFKPLIWLERFFTWLPFGGKYYVCSSK